MIHAIIPIKKRSTRLPNKNFLPLGDKKMWMYPFITLLKHPLINHITWTVCPDINGAELAEFYTELTNLTVKHNRSNRVVHVYTRPEHLCEDSAVATDFLADAINESRMEDDDTVVFTHPINPFITVEMIDRALQKHKAYYPHPVISVTELRQKLWSSSVVHPYGEATNHNPYSMEPTQSITPIYIENCSLYVFNVGEFRKQKSHQTDCPVLMTVDPIEGWDIDEPWEYEVAQGIHSHREWEKFLIKMRGR